MLSSHSKDHCVVANLKLCILICAGKLLFKLPKYDLSVMFSSPTGTNPLEKRHIWLVQQFEFSIQLFHQRLR